MLYRMFVAAMDSSIIAACHGMPKNFRQYYADQLLLLRVQIEFGRLI